MKLARALWLLAGVAMLAVLLAALLLRVRAGRHPHPKTPAATGVPDLSITSPLNQPGGGLAPSEAYEVYSALYQAPVPEPLAFVENSSTDIPQVNGNCLSPSSPEEREMADAFAAANRQSHRWEHRFVIPQGYRLLSPGESAEAQVCLETHGVEAARCASYRQLRHVRYLGVPGFNRARTRALVSVIKKCGRDCGSGGLFVVEKDGDAWRRSETTSFTRDCSWAY
ncbi:MAG TPA: hypothetical protein VGR96_06140 [Acidobacteriaceae bacterium]|nr:hypothetical protein [Acidobacteriaceae bacterium]